MPKISCKNLTVTYLNKNKDEYTAIDDLTVEFESEKINVIMGENGCGKSTLLMAICGMFKYDGEIFFDNENIENVDIKDLKISYIDQNFSLYPHMLVYDNICYPLTILKMSPEEIDKRVKGIANELGISFLLGRKPRELSIGQQQRVAIARALIKNPNVILMDEIMSNIDVPNQVEIKKIIKKLVKLYKITCLYVTHNLQEAMEMGDKIYLMDKGKIVEKEL